jgi:hypothetical protein
MTQSSFHDTMIALPAFQMDSLSSPASLALADRMNGLFSPLSITAEQFLQAYDLPIGEHVEKNYKGLSYLSWPFAFRYLKQEFPGLYVAFEESTLGWPVFGQIGCWLLRPYLTDGCSRTPALVFPLMDNKHNALKELDARAVSDNIQRASVKCIATFTGLGLKLYSGEDIPKSDEKEQPKLALQQEAKKPVPRASAKPAEAPAIAAPTGGEAAPAANAVEFDGKASLLAFAKANPFNYGEERASMMAAKNALENLGLSKGEDLKDSGMFANAVVTMLSSWMKENNITVAKAAMVKEVDTLRAICTEGTVDQAIAAVKLFVEGKK